MEGLPPLPEDRARLLEVGWIVLRESFRSTGTAYTRQISELVVARFDQIANEYLTIWKASEERTEVFQQWLHCIKHLVSTEMIGLRLALQFERNQLYGSFGSSEGLTAIESSLSQAAATWGHRAGELEISRLEPKRQANGLDAQQASNPIAGFTYNHDWLIAAARQKKVHGEDIEQLLQENKRLIRSSGEMLGSASSQGASIPQPAISLKPLPSDSYKPPGDIRAEPKAKAIESGNNRQRDTHAKKSIPQELVRARYDTLTRHRNQKNGQSVAAFAHNVGASVTAVHGIVREDRNRYSDEKRDRLLRELGITLETWNSAEALKQVDWPCAPESRD
jgi:hypothetical protein